MYIRGYKGLGIIGNNRIQSLIPNPFSPLPQSLFPAIAIANLGAFLIMAVFECRPAALGCMH